MKKLLLLVSLFTVLFSAAQVEPPTSKYTKVANGYNWLRGYFKALNLPVGNAPVLGTDQWTASGGIYLDTLDGDGTPQGLWLYIRGVWVFQGIGSVDCSDKLLNGGSVSYTQTGLVFNVTPSLVRLCCIIYGFDSTQVTLPPGDPDFNKQYVIYLDSTGVHVKEGVPGTPAAVPQLEACQLALTSVLVEAGQSVPAITTQVIYDENTESTVANTGTTTDGASAVFPFTGSLATRVTVVNNGDTWTWTKVLGGFWSLSGVDALSLAVHLRAVQPTLAEIRVQLFNGTSAVSGEVIIAVNKNNASTYQQISIPISAFGTITNSNFTTVRIRYSSNNANNFAGYDFDRLELVSGLPQNPPGSAVTSVGITVGGNLYNVTNSPITTAGNIVLTPAGNALQYVNGLGIRVTFPDFPRVIGPMDGRAKNDDGMTLDGDTLFGHLADRYNNGFMSKEDWIRLNRGDSIQNIGDGDTLVTLVNDSTIGVKSIKVVGGSITSTDTTMTLTFSGGSSLTEGEGTAVSGDSVHVGGLIASPSRFFNERAINLNRKIMHWTNGVAPEAGGAYWQFTQRPYSPYQFISSDTVSVDNQLPEINRPLSGLFARRTLYFNSGIRKADQSYGHYIGQTYSWADSMVVKNDGMDYGQAAIVEQRYKPRNSGYQVIRLANGTGNDARKLHATPTFLANTNYDAVDGASTDTLRTRGVTVGIVSYLVAATGSGKIRADEHVYFQTGNFMNSNTHFNRTTVLARAQGGGEATAGVVDTAYFLWDTLRTSKSMLNNMVLNFGDSTQSGYGFKNYGTSWFKNFVRISDGTEGLNKVFTSDANGVGTWQTPASGGVTTMGAITSANANGAIITGSTLQLSPASATTGGILTTGSQQISGNKTFNNLLIAGDELRIENTYRLRDITASGFYDYFQPGTLTTDHQYYFADSDNAVDTIATRAYARTVGGGGGGSVAWGAIIGTLSSQSDLNTALSGKASTTLNNLGTTSINADLIPSSDNARDIGTSSAGFKDTYTRRVLMKGSTSGTAEIKSDALSNTLQGTVLAGTGGIPVSYNVFVRSDETLANSTSDQPLFTNTAHDVFAVLANTTYFFSTQFDLSHGAVTHTLSFGMVPTTATITNIAYNSSVWTTAIGTGTNTQTSNRIKATATTQIQATGLVNVESVEISGWFTVGNTGGTIQPMIKFNADPTGTILTKAGAYFRMWVAGNDTITENGPWQ